MLQLDINFLYMPFIYVCCCIFVSVPDVTTRPKGEKIPHEQQMKFFGKVQYSFSVSFYKRRTLFYLPPRGNTHRYLLSPYLILWKLFFHSCNDPFLSIMITFDTYTTGKVLKLHWILGWASQKHRRCVPIHLLVPCTKSMSSFCEENIHTFECVAKDYASTGAYYMYCIYICVFKCFSKALFHFRLNKPSESLVLLEPPSKRQSIIRTIWFIYLDRLFCLWLTSTLRTIVSTSCPLPSVQSAAEAMLPIKRRRWWPGGG